ncbi:MAG: response regulator [Armatimonadetes bacterium]|nr:response regulator [Armatimonadota bacterium]
MQLSWTFDNARSLVIDDNLENVKVVRRLLEGTGCCAVEGVTDPTKAVEAYRRYRPDVILLDLHMPVLDGYEVLALLKSAGAVREFVPVLVCTADESTEARQKALDLGASDFITKPFDATELVLRIRNFLHMRHIQVALREQNVDLEAMIVQRTFELHDARSEAIHTLARAAEYRDDITGDHTQRVGHMSSAISVSLGLDAASQNVIRMAAPLHDVGKIGVTDKILLKPGKLTHAEFEAMKKHTVIGAQIIGDARSPVLEMARDIALSHHERWDGSGYPAGLPGLDIPLAARIVAVADVYDALTHERPYKEAWPVAQAVAEIRYQSGKQFDPDIVDAFLSIDLDDYEKDAIE